MNPISAFLESNIVFVYFVYGLAFFTLGIALQLKGSRKSQFKFATALRPLAAFGFLHATHEWIEMLQIIANFDGSYSPVASHEIFRVAILVASFLMLLVFGIILLTPEHQSKWRIYLPILLMLAMWAGGTWLVAARLHMSLPESLPLADVLSRYGLGIPGALLGTWALMMQQRTFREHRMPRFGRDLVWSATALFLYGAIGQIFVHRTVLFPSIYLNSDAFIQWFGIPVQLFRAILAGLLSFFLVRALSAFNLEDQRMLEAANQAKLAAQAEALAAERDKIQTTEQLNQELRLITRELMLLLNLSNLLVTPLTLTDRLHNVLQEIVNSLNFPEAAMILLSHNQTPVSEVVAAINFPEGDNDSPKQAYRYAMARDLGEQCLAKKMAMCIHTDGVVIEFLLEEALATQRCREHLSPTHMLGLPLVAHHRVFGSLVLSIVPPRSNVENPEAITPDELRLIVGMTQQLGLSIDNAQLYQDAQNRKQLLEELLHQVVNAQEAERQRIARELHDATGQSLTAIALGLRGVENLLQARPTEAIQHIQELKLYSTNALGELKQLISDLRPPQLDDLGLISALQWYIDTYQKYYDLTVTLLASNQSLRLPSKYETVLFRITQEALTNVAKHAQAKHVSVSFEQEPDQLVMTIEDDGRGFDLNVALNDEQGRVGWGLLGIAERVALLNGRHQIITAPQQGTRIVVNIPLAQED